MSIKNIMYSCNTIWHEKYALIIYIEKHGRTKTIEEIENQILACTVQL